MFRKFRKITLLAIGICCTYMAQSQVTKMSDLLPSRQTSVINETRTAGDDFGHSVAVDGDIMVVGAKDHALDTNGENSMIGAGAAYVFYRNEGGTDNWGLIKKLVASGTNARNASDQFGWRVAISGSVIVVSAHLHGYDENGANFLSLAGAAYVFHKDEGGTDNWGQKAKLVGSGTNGRVAGDRFGMPGISGDIIVIGAVLQGYDAGGANFLSNAGAAYVFYRNQGGTDNWGLVKKIAGTGTNGRVTQDNFGGGVAISGNTIVVGAVGQGYDATGNNFLSYAGAAYIFGKDEGGTDNWGLVKKLVGSGTNGRVASDYFGITFDIDGDVIVVGAHFQDYDASGANLVSNAGAAYVFYRNQGGTDNWGLVKKLVGSGTNGRVADDAFGAVTIDGDIIAVGASGQDYDAGGANFVSSAGAIYIYYKNEGGTDNWGQKQKIVAGGSSGRVVDDAFGGTVTIDGSVIAEGVIAHDYDANGADSLNSAGTVYIFHQNEGGTDNWGQVQKRTSSGSNGREVNDYFGLNVAASGTIVVVGAPGQDYDADGENFLDGPGAAYVFYKDQGGTDNWGLVKKLVGSGTNGRIASDFFGVSVAVSGNTIVIGAEGQDYDASGANFLSNAGAAYVFYKDQGGTDNWGLVKKLVGSGTNGRVASDFFGQAVAISDDVIAVGALGQDYDASGANFLDGPGAAYVFYKDQGGTDNWGLLKKLVGTGTNGRVTGDNFGKSIAISSNIIAVGATGQDYDASGANFLNAAGAAYVFYKDEGGTDNWGQKTKLVGSGTNGRVSGDNFGESIAISSNIIAVGAPDQDYDASGANSLTSAGAAYVFYKDEGGADNWGRKAKLVGSGTNGRGSLDDFGESIAISGNNVIVGAADHDYDENGANVLTSPGAAYLFNKDEGGTDNWGTLAKLVNSGTNGRIAHDDFGGAVTISDDKIVVAASLQDYDANGGNFVSAAGKATVFKIDGLRCVSSVWSPSAPNTGTGADNATIVSGTCAISANGNVKSIEIQSGAILNITSGSLTVSEDFTNNGTSTGTGSITLAGTTAQGILGTGTTNNLILNNAAGANITDSLKIAGVYTHTAGVLTTNSKLKLVATNATTYGQIAGTGSGSTNGTVTAEYIIPSTSSGKWRSISSPFTGNTIGDLADDININYGTPSYIYSNVWTHDESNGGSSNRGAWAPISSSTQSMDNNAYSVYLWDDDVANDITLDLTGTYTSGNYTSPALTRTGSITDTSGWHILRNPWPSNYNHNTTITNLVSNTIYVYEGNTARDWNGTTGSLSNGVVPPFHGIYVQINTHNNTLTFPTANRTTSNSNNYFDKGALLNYVGIKATNEDNIWDETRVYQNENAENGLDFGDAVKIVNGLGAPTIYTLVENNKIGINLLKEIPTNGISFPLVFSAYESGKYTLSFTEDNIESDVEVILEDLDTKTEHKVTTGDYEFTYNHTNGTKQRFVLHYKRKSGTTNVKETTNNKNIYVGSQGKTVTLSFLQQGDYKISVYDLMGRKITQANHTTNGGTLETLELNGVATGYYIVKVENAAQQHTFKVFID